MRRLILALLLLLPLLAVPCSGAEVPSFPQVDELLEEAEGYGVEGTDGLEAGARSILSAAGAQLDGLIRRSLRLGLKLMAVVLLCGLAEAAVYVALLPLLRSLIAGDYVAAGYLVALAAALALLHSVIGFFADNRGYCIGI